MRLLLILLCSSCLCLTVQAQADYESDKNDGIKALDRGEKYYYAAKEAFVRARGVLSASDSKSEIDSLIRVADNKIITLLEKRRKEAEENAEVAEKARQAEEAARKEAERQEKIAKEQKEIAVQAEFREKKARKAAVATHLSYGAGVELKGENFELAKKLAYYGLLQIADTSFPKDTLFPLVRQAFGDVVYKTTITQLGGKEARKTKTVRDFICSPTTNTLALLVSPENSESVKVVDELWLLPLPELSKPKDTLYLSKSEGPLTLVENDPISTFTFSPQGNQLLVGTQQGMLNLFSLDGNRSWSKKITDRSAILSITFSPDGKQFITTDQIGKNKVWNYSLNTPSEVLEIKELTNTPVYETGYSPDKQRIYTRSGNSQVKLWDTNGKEIKNLDKLPIYTHKAAFSRDGSHLIATTADGTVHSFEGSTGDLIGQYQSPNQKAAIDFVFSPDGRNCYIAFGEGEMAVCPLDLKSCSSHQFESGIVSMSVSDSLSYPALLLGFENGKAVLIDISSKIEENGLNLVKDGPTMLLDEHIVRFPSDKYSIKKTAFSFDASYLLTLDEKGTLFICHSPKYIKRQLDDNPPILTEEEKEQFSVTDNLLENIGKN